MTPEFYERLGIHTAGAMRTALSPTEQRLLKQLQEFEQRLRQDVSPFGARGPAARARRWREAATTDAFARLYAPHYASSEPDAVHADLDALVDGYVPPGHPDGEAYVHVLHGPREHAKSIRSRLGLLKRVLRGSLRYPIIISEHLYLAEAHLDYLLVDLTANTRIQDDFGVEVLLRDRSAGTLRLRVTPRHTGTAHLVQLDAASYGRPVKGRVFMQHRPDFVLIDDFENTRSAKNEAISREKADWVLQEVYPAVVGPVLWLGNVGHDSSALYHAICRAEGARTGRPADEAGKALMRRGTRPGLIAVAAGLLAPDQAGRPAPEDPPGARAPESPPDARETQDYPEYPRSLFEGTRTPSDGSTGQPGAQALSAYVYRAERLVVAHDGSLQTEYLWSRRYPPEWYARRRATMGPFLYDGEFNGFPSREGDFFRREWLDEALYDALPEQDERPLAWFSWFDPAFGKSGSGCYKAIVVCATDGDDVFVVDAYVRNSEPTSAALDAWADFFRRYDRLGLRHGQYENDFGQEDRLHRDIEDARTRHGFRLNVSGDSNRRGAKDARIESLQPLVSTRRLRFPRARHADLDRLFNQLLAYPGGADDGPDALESCIARLRRGAAGDIEYATLGERRYARHGRRSSRRR